MERRREGEIENKLEVDTKIETTDARLFEYLYAQVRLRTYVYHDLLYCHVAGRLWRPVRVSDGRVVAAEWNHQLGLRLRSAQETRRVHAYFKICQMD